MFLCFLAIADLFSARIADMVHRDKEIKDARLNDLNSAKAREKLRQLSRGKYPKPSPAELVIILSQAIEKVNAKIATRNKIPTGVGVVETSWHLPGWVANTRVHSRLREMLDEDFSDVDHVSALEHVYRNTFMATRAPREEAKKVRVEWS